MRAIESFNLFGEDADLPDVVHCETIAARSVKHDWEYSPHRHGRLHQFLLIDTGGGRASLDDRQIALMDGMIVNIPTGCVHSYRFRAGTAGWVVTVPTEVLEMGLAQGEGLRPLLARPTVLPSDTQIRDTILRLFAEYEGRHFARAHVLRSETALLAGLTARAIAATEPRTPSDSPLQRRFETLIEMHFADHWPVATYADALGVTPTHLSRVMRAATGAPASAAILDRLIREARRHLAYSNLTVAQVAYALGYQDPGYFSRVFTRATGLSPSGFRTQHGVT
ncbi:helix-turn-helix domain-containing protein [Maritimibacter sp. DP1N21-5]|nr:helix-turn-helix domain-containing protein [Maritimibacter sp. DP1N21-5]